MGRVVTSTIDRPPDSEVWVFQWQEKVFSQVSPPPPFIKEWFIPDYGLPHDISTVSIILQHEEELYADANNCSTALEDKYHRDIIALRCVGVPMGNEILLRKWFIFLSDCSLSRRLPYYSYFLGGRFETEAGWIRG